MNKEFKQDDNVWFEYGSEFRCGVVREFVNGEYYRVELRTSDVITLLVPRDLYSTRAELLKAFIGYDS